MAKSISSDIQREGELSFGKAIVPARQYLLRRIGAIFPYLLLSTLIAAIVRIVSGEWSLSEIMYHLVGTPSEFMFLQNYGFITPSFTGVVWYLCASFFAMALLYPIMRCYYESYNRYFAPIIALLISGIIQNYYGTLCEPDSFFLQVFNTGFLRAIAMVSLGGFVYEMSVKLANISFSKIGMFLMTTLEMFLYAGVFAYIGLWRSEIAKADSYIVIYMALAVMLTLSGKSLLYEKADNRFSLFLGKVSSVLFLNHYYWFFAAKSLFENVSLWVKLGAIALSIITSLLVYAGGNCLIKIYPKIKKCFINGAETNC